MKNIIWYLFAGTRGGVTRAKIIKLLLDTPANANKISQLLNIDYKTVRHHLKVLGKNKLIYALEKEKYGAVYFLSEQMQFHFDIFNKIWDKIGTNLGKN